MLIPFFLFPPLLTHYSAHEKLGQRESEGETGGTDKGEKSLFVLFAYVMVEEEECGECVV